MNLKDVATCELVEELKSREGVKHQIVRVEEAYEIVTLTGNPTVSGDCYCGDGPAILFAVID